jgi:hypothetical protein
MNSKTLNLLIITFSIVFLIGSLIISIVKNDPMLFSRSGSVIVLLGATMEYTRIIRADKKNEYVPGTPVSLGKTRQLFNISKEDNCYRLISNVMIVLGTIVWGYGDLIF